MYPSTKQRRAKHSFLPPPNRSLTSTDEMAILLQLGYIPSNACRVSARSGDKDEKKLNINYASVPSHTTVTTTDKKNKTETSSTIVNISAVEYGRPIAIQCYPLLVQLMPSSSPASYYSSNDSKAGDNISNNRRMDNDDGVDDETNMEQDEDTIITATATPATTAISTRTTTIITPFPTLYWLTCPHVSRAISELERAGYARIFWERLLSLQQPEHLKQNISDYENKERTNINMNMMTNEKTDTRMNMEWNHQWRECHDEYASERWNSLSVEDQRRFGTTECDHDDDKNERESMRYILQCSGVAGTEYQSHFHDEDITMASSCSNLRRKSTLPSVKCLHAHYAHYRSQISSLDNAKEGKKEISINIVGKWTHELLVERFPDILF